jgi:two-component system sensor histidine kinase PilS (NtrC family)
MVLVYGNSHAFFLLATIFNLLLTSYSRGPHASLKLGVFALALFNFSFLWLEFRGVDVPTSHYLIFNLGILGGALLSSGLSLELQSLVKTVEGTQEDLRELRNLSDLLIENMGPGVLALSASGEIIRANRGAARIFETIGLIGKPLRDLSDPLWEIVLRVKTAETHELEHVNIQGAPILLEAVISPIKGRGPEHRGWVVMLQDRTEVKNLEAALRQKDKLAAVGQLAAGIAHEIRNPLASISGSVQLLAGTLDTATPEDKKLLAIIVKEIDRLNDLITEFLDYVRPDVVAKENVSLPNLLREVLEMVAQNPTLPRQVKQEFHFAGDCVIRGHHDKLKQAILNILINAYQAMDTSAEKNLHVEVRELEQFVELRIQDSGIGISRDRIGRIFEPFHTTKPKGTGLGLAITHKVLESHGAEVDVQSRVGEGTVFTLRFPRNTN